MVETRTIYQQIQDHAKNGPDALALLGPGKEPISYRLLARHLESTAFYLARLGFCQGERLAVVLPNGPELASAFLAVSSVCTCIPLNPAYSLEEFTFSLKDLRVNGLVVLMPGDHPSRKAATALGIPVIELEADSRMAGIFRLDSSQPVDETVRKPIFAGLENPALVLHTSGTTSRPKIVPLSQRNLAISMENIAACYRLTPGDRCLNMMPLFHIHGLIGAVAASLSCGGSVICAPGFVPEKAMEWLADMEPTWYTAVPTIHQALLEQSLRSPETLKRAKLRFIRSCSSALAPQVAQDLETAFGTPVVEAYGMTEAAHQIASNPLPPRSRKFGSVGQPSGSVQVRILDEQGNPLPAEEAGEICIQGENVITGYENNPQANLANFTGSWLRTGDRGYLDADGYIHIQGRIKEIINRGGEKISPLEIDEVLLRHPAVRQAAAFPVPHPSLGEDVAAAVVLKPGMEINVLELRQHAAACLADFKVPRQILFVDEIPRGATGKIQRTGLWEKLRDRLEAGNMHQVGIDPQPASPVEAAVLSIWQEVMRNQEIGLQDDFLALGGDSIQAMQILTRVNERFGADLQISDLFSAPTVVLMGRLLVE